jgi:hypothetical protein
MTNVLSRAYNQTAMLRGRLDLADMKERSVDSSHAVKAPATTTHIGTAPGSVDSLMLAQPASAHTRARSCLLIHGL